MSLLTNEIVMNWSYDIKLDELLKNSNNNSELTTKKSS
jgi:hypothetical protein